MISIRPPEPGDEATLIAGRDVEFHRFLGEGEPHPLPAYCIVVDDAVVGWVDHDIDRTWLLPGECNVGYNVLPEHRGHGYASQAVRLLLQQLAVDGELTVATLLIHPDNERSLALAHRLGFTPQPDLDSNKYFKHPIP